MSKPKEVVKEVKWLGPQNTEPMDELKFGRFELSFTPRGTVVIRVGGDSADWSMFSYTEAEKLKAFIQKYLDSFNKPT